MSQGSLLLRLPGELRNEIYKNLLTVPGIAPTTCIHFHFIIDPPKIDRTPLPTSILCTCRQIYQEAHLLPLHFDGFLALRCYMQRLSVDQRSTLKSLHVDMSTHGEMYIHRALPPAPFRLDNVAIYIGKRQPSDYDCSRIETYLLEVVGRITINFDPSTPTYSPVELYRKELFQKINLDGSKVEVKVTKWADENMSQLVMYHT